jgi:hypothetical protein
MIVLGWIIIGVAAVVIVNLFTLYRRGVIERII